MINYIEWKSLKYYRNYQNVTQRHEVNKSCYKNGADVFAQYKVKVTQSCLTLCDPMDYKVHGILQARILEWEAILFSRGSSRPGIEPTSFMSLALAGRFFTCPLFRIFF